MLLGELLPGAHGRWPVREIGEGLTGPEVEHPAERGGVVRAGRHDEVGAGQVLEPVHVDVVRVDLKPVAAGRRHDGAGIELLPEPEHVGLEGLALADRRTAGPQGIHEIRGRHLASDGQGERCAERTLLRPRERLGRIAEPRVHRERPERPHQHRTAHYVRPTVAVAARRSCARSRRARHRPVTRFSTRGRRSWGRQADDGRPSVPDGR